MKTTIETITPNRAAVFLKCNNHNRNIRTTHVKWLAKQMATGQWRMTHQGIAFDEHGNLIDGQHRLMAIIESGVTVSMCITRGISIDAFYVCDIGIGRTIADITNIPRKTVELLTVLAGMYYHHGFHGKMTVDQITLFNRVFASAVDQLNGTDRKGTTKAPVRAAFVLAIAEGNPVAEIYQQMVRLDFTSLPPIMGNLARQLLQSESRGTKNQRTQQFVRTLKAIDARNENTSIIQIHDLQLHVQNAAKRIARVIEKEVEL